MTAVLILLTLSSAQAQLRKCTAPDGRVTYSDIVCNSASTTGGIKNADGNTLDASGSRQLVEGARSEKQSKAAKDIASNSLQNCKFSYHAINDEKGKQLAQSAKEECLRNNEAKLNGGATSLEHYGFWKDHYNQKSNERQALAARLDANSRAVQQNSSSRKGFTCRPNMLGDALNCD